MSSDNGKKIRVALVYGGKSGEHEVSLISAYSVLRALDPQCFEVLPIGIDKGGKWFFNRLPEVLAYTADSHEQLLPARLQNAQRVSLSEPAEAASVLGGPIDVVFSLIHGTFGEDGCMQGFLELADLPYVGAGVLGSAIGMDKDVAKRLVQAAGIAVSPFKTVFESEFLARKEAILAEINRQFSGTIFVKPVNAGSSVGIHKVTDKQMLEKAMLDAFHYDDKIIVEAGVNAREIEISVLENTVFGELPLVSLPGEVKVSKKHDFYSYQAKYLDPEGADLVIPAAIPEEKIKEIQSLAQLIFKTLNVESMARVDFFFECDTGLVLFNEINTIPGFTPISMYPKMWEASGVPYTELVRKLVELAIARHKRKQRKIRSYQ